MFQVLPLEVTRTEDEETTPAEEEGRRMSSPGTLDPLAEMVSQRASRRRVALMASEFVSISFPMGRPMVVD